jgi:hypothetical protein
MANPEHLKILKQGVEVWNRWRRENPNIIPDLNQADLREMELNGAKLSRADLSKAHLRGTFFEGTGIGRTIFGTIDLSKAIGLENVKGMNRFLYKSYIKRFIH